MGGKKGQGSIVIKEEIVWWDFAGKGPWRLKIKIMRNKNCPDQESNLDL